MNELMMTGVEAAAQEWGTYMTVKNNLVFYQAQSGINQPPENSHGVL